MCKDKTKQHLVPKTDRIRVLYIDDEVNNLIALKASFRHQFDITTTEQPILAIELVKKHNIEVVISDQRMPKMTGIEFFNQLKTVLPDPSRILLTGYSDMSAAIDAINLGEIYRYITKPWDYDHLLAAIKAAYELYWLRQEKQALQNNLIQTNDQLEFMLRQKILS